MQIKGKDIELLMRQAILMENNIKNSVIKNYQKSKEMVSNAQEKGSTYYKEKSKAKGVKTF